MGKAVLANDDSHNRFMCSLDAAAALCVAAADCAVPCAVLRCAVLCDRHADGEADEAAAAEGKKEKKKKSKKDLDSLFASLGDEEGGAAANGVEAAEVRVWGLVSKARPSSSSVSYKCLAASQCSTAGQDVVANVWDIVVSHIC